MISIFNLKEVLHFELLLEDYIFIAYEWSTVNECKSKLLYSPSTIVAAPCSKQAQYRLGMSISLIGTKYYQ